MQAMPVLCLGALLSGCRKNDEGVPLPPAGALEEVEIVWEDAPFPGAIPSVVRFDDAWHLYFTGKEGSLTSVFHATSTDGVSFELVSSHRIVDELTDAASDVVSSAVATNSGTRVHLLANLSAGATSEVWHATSTDGHEFTLDASAAFAAGASPPSGSPEAYTVTGAVFEASEITALLRVDLAGDNGDPEIRRITSSDGGETWTEPATALSPNDLPTPWGSTTCGAGGMWGATLATDPDGGYHALYLGAAPNGTDAIGVGQAWSGDGEAWTSEGELWFEPEAGLVVNGLSLVSQDDGWWLWLSMAEEGADPLTDGVFYRMWIE